MKKAFLLFVLLFQAAQHYAQVIYYNGFDNLTLQTYTTSGSTTKFAAVPSNFSLINDGLSNNIGSLQNPNKPFNEPSLKTAGWEVVYNDVDNDTFLVSTSWLDTTGIPVDRWVITPMITGISANSVLTWLAKSPDATYPDGYEVYGTTNTGALTPQNFAIGDRLFALADGNTSGAGEKKVWTRRSVNIGAFAGQNLRFAFRNISKDMYQLWIDDIEIINVSNNFDAGLSNSVQKKYILSNIPDSVKFNLTNYGATAITLVNMSYQVGNSSVNTENIYLPTGLAYGQSTPLKFALPYSVSVPQYYLVKCWINSVNGSTDQYLPNDTIVYSLTVQNTTPTKTVLLEQFVSADNGESPDAQDKTQAIQSPTLIVVNIHDLDSLKENNSSALINDYKKEIPTAMADRFYFDDLQSVAMERQSYYYHTFLRSFAVTPASVSIINKIYNSVTRQLSFTLRADFTGEVKGDYRLNAFLTENNVSGPVTDTTINGYNQLNNFFNVSWSPYYEKGYYSFIAGTYVLNYWQFRHQNALVYAFDGAYGSNTTIPSVGGTQGQQYQQTFTMTVPTPSNGIHKFNPDNLYIVGFVAEYSPDKNNRTVLNAVKEKVTSNPEAVGLKEVSLNSGILVYPNPSTGLFYFNSDLKSEGQIRIFDVFGKCVKEAHATGQTGSLDLWGFTDGIYILQINSGDQLITEKLILQR